MYSERMVNLSPVEMKQYINDLLDRVKALESVITILQINKVTDLKLASLGTAAEGYVLTYDVGLGAFVPEGAPIE